MDSGTQTDHALTDKGLKEHHCLVPTNTLSLRTQSRLSAINIYHSLILSS